MQVEPAPAFGAVVGSVPLTMVSMRPLKPLFKTHAAPTREELLGRVCVVSTGNVTATFGQAECQTGGASLLVQVRCPEPNALRRGSEGVLVDYDPDHEVFMLEPLPSLIDPTTEESPESAEAADSAGRAGRS